jgi:hypothetical protein
MTEGAETPYASLAPSPWVRRFMPLIRPGGLVLDLAAGDGRHSCILIESGFAVRAVDRDISALLTLAGPRCEVSQIDLETFARGNERLGRPHNPDFLLRPGELLTAFARLTVSAFEEGEVTAPRPAVVQRIAAVAGAVGRLPEYPDLDSRRSKE